MNRMYPRKSLKLCSFELLRILNDLNSGDSGPSSYLFYIKRGSFISKKAFKTISLESLSIFIKP